METQERQAIVRLLNDNDYQGLLRIQRENAVGSVPAGQRAGGFLSAEFTVDQLRAMHESAGIVVATVGDSLAAFFCLSTLEANQDAPIVMAMRETMRSVLLDGRPIESCSFVVAGPICIDKQYRGSGLFERLYEFAVNHFATRFELAVAFIAQENQRSLKAHEKVGMVPLAQFEYRGAAYDLVARRL